MEQPPRKKPNRVHPWRDEYVHDLGVRVVDRDASTGDVLTAECRFCAAFGREERVLIEDAKTLAAGRVNDGSSNDDIASSGQGHHDTAVSADKSSNGSNNESCHKRKSRARTRSIAQWKTSFRSDNMRSHHVEQHPLKWGAYQQLLALAKKEQAVSGVLEQQPHANALPNEGNGGDAGDYTQKLAVFFGVLSASDEAPITQIAPTTLSSEVQLTLSTPKRRGRKVSLNKTTSTSSQQRQQIQDKVVLPTVDSSTPAEVLVLTEITSPAIVDDIVSSLIDTGASEPPASSRAISIPSSSWIVFQPIYSAANTVEAPVLNAPANTEGRPEPPARLQASIYQIALESASEYVYVRQLLAMEDSVKFAQISKIVAISRAQFNLEATLSSVSQDTVCEYAKLVVATDLQMISDMLRGSWAYSLALQSSDTSRVGLAIEVRVRLPSAGGTGVEDFHVVTVTTPVSKSRAPSASALVELIIKTLAALDPLWQKKLIGVCDEASMRSMDVVASVLDLIQEAAAADQPFYRVYRGAQIVEASLLKALDGSLVNSDTYTGDQAPRVQFLDQLDAAAQSLNSQPQWSKTHGLCPLFSTQTSPWSLLQTLQWFIIRREQIGQLQTENESSSPPKAASLSSEWWVVCLGLTEVLSDYESIYQALANKTQSQQRPSAARDVLSQFIQDQTSKLGISQVETAAQTNGDDDDDASLRLNQFHWSKDKIVAFFRSLNLSTRRLYSQLSPQEQTNAVHQVGAFVLQALDTTSNMISEGVTKKKLTSHFDSAAELDADIVKLLPTRPLDFAAIERGAVVDFIELHSARLELSFDLAFIDAVSKQIKDLKSLIAAGDPVTTKAKLVAVHAKSFREAWEPVESFSFVRSLAAGCATAVPHSTVVSVEAQPVRSRSCVSTGVCLASLQAEAQAHAIQTEAVEAAFKSFKLGSTTSDNQ